jgi:hypothetical protein
MDKQTEYAFNHSLFTLAKRIGRFKRCVRDVDKSEKGPVRVLEARKQVDASLNLIYIIKDQHADSRTSHVLPERRMA